MSKVPIFPNFHPLKLVSTGLLGDVFLTKVVVIDVDE